MLTAKILYPDTLHGNRIIECLECGLSYIKKDFMALSDAWKLKYFKLSSGGHENVKPDIIVCHNCLFAILKDLAIEAKTSPVKFKILTRLQEIEFDFFPEQYANMQLGTHMDDFLATLDALNGDFTDDTDETPPREGASPDW